MRGAAAGILLFGLLAAPIQVLTEAQALAPEQEVAKSIDKNVEASNKLFPCPKAKWDVVKQPFWRHRTVLKLRSCQWPHRPTVVIDEEGSARLITDEIQIIPEKPALDQFNAMAKRESAEINADDAADYLQFFINVHLNSRARLYFGGGALAQKVKTLWQQSDAKRFSEEADHLKAELVPLDIIPVTEVDKRREFRATVFEWSPDWAHDTTNPPGIERFDITIHQDGTIALTSKWIWRTAL